PLPPPTTPAWKPLESGAKSDSGIEVKVTGGLGVSSNGVVTPLADSSANTNTLPPAVVAQTTAAPGAQGRPGENPNPFSRPPAPTIPPLVNTAGTTNPASNPAAQEMIAAGMIDFRATPLDQVLQVYADFVGRTLLRPANLGAPQVTLQTKTP